MKPDDVSQEAWDAAGIAIAAAFAANSLGRKVTETETIARAIMAETELCAAICDRIGRNHGQWANAVHLAEVADECAWAIRARSQAPKEAENG